MKASRAASRLAVLILAAVGVVVPIQLASAVTPTGTLTVPVSTYVNKVATASAKFTPRNPGRPVQLEQDVDGAWVPIATGKQNRRGKATFTFTMISPGTFTLRAVALPWRTKPTVTTPAKPLTVTPDPVVVSTKAEPLTASEADAIASYDPATGVLKFAKAAPTSVTSIVTGDIVVVPPRPGLDTGGLLKVTKTATTTSGRVLTTSNAASLPDVISNVPDDATEIGLAAQTPPQISNLADGVTVTTPTPTANIYTAKQARRAGAAAINLDGPSVTATIHAALKDTVGGVDVSATTDGTLTITPTAELGLDLNWFHVKSYKVGAGLKQQGSLDATVTGTVSKAWTKKLFTVTQVRGGMIGTVPVWVSITGDITLHVTIDGKATASVSWNRSGADIVGVQGTDSDGYSPHPYSTRASTTAAGGASAEGKAHADVTGTLEMDLYSLAGPYASLGYQLDASASISTSAPLTCQLNHGPTAQLGVRSSDVFKKLTGKALTFAEHTYDLPQTVVASCPTPSPSPSPSPTATATPSPTATPTATASWDSISVGYADFTCATRTDSTLWCWGYNNYGQLGIGNTSDSSVPVQVPGSWLRVEAGAWNACGIKTDGSLWCWGAGSSGELGNGSTDPSAVPVQVPGSWTDMSTRGNDVCAIKTDDSLWCWGYGQYGELGVGSTENRSVPTQVPGQWAAVSAGHSHTCGIKTDGSGWCWGSNFNGELGPDVPRQDPSLGQPGSTVPVRIAGDWVRLVAGSGVTCGHRSDGTVGCWGDNSAGQLGLGDTHGFAAYNPNATDLVGAWKRMSLTHGVHACGVQADNTGWCWGTGTDGQLGTGDTRVNVPAQVPGSWVLVSTEYKHSCGVKTDGGAWCWGLNGHGQLGNGSTNAAQTPTRVADPT